jgi:hypothetical protein
VRGNKMLIFAMAGLILVYIYTTMPRMKFKSALGKGYGNKIKILEYQKRYDMSFLIPIPMGFSYVILQDVEGNFLFDVGHNYKKTNHTYNVDGTNEIKTKISESRSEEEKFIEKLEIKVSELRECLKEDFFVIFDDKKNKYRIVTFLSKNSLYKGKITKNSDIFDTYLKKNKSDEFYIFSKDLKKYFSEQIKKGYFASVEKNIILKELKWGTNNLISSAEFLPKMVFFSYCKVTYTDKEIIEKRIESHFKPNSTTLRNVKGTIQKNYFESFGQGEYNIIYSAQHLISELAEEKFYEEYHKHSGINYANDFLIYKDGRFEYEVYDLYYENSSTIVTRYLNYNFLNDNLTYYQD